MDYRTATREERAAEFIDFAETLHDGRYDYSLVPAAYVNGDTRVTIVCPDHGPFELTPREHRRVRETPWGPQRGQGCRDCKSFNASLELRRQRFFSKAVEVHGHRYDYREVTYVDAKTDVTVLCTEHGPFSVRPDNHTSKYPSGCPDCALQGHRTAPRSRKKTEEGQWRKRPAGSTTGRKRTNRNRANAR